MLALIGQSVVAGFFAVANLLSGESAFHTVERLGRVLLSSRGPEAGAIAVLAYGGMHLALFLLLGLVIAALVEATECHPKLAVPCLTVTVVGVLVAELLFLYATRAAFVDLPWWSVAAANVAAGAAMAAYACRRHRGLLGRITREAL